MTNRRFPSGHPSPLSVAALRLETEPGSGTRPPRPPPASLRHRSPISARPPTTSGHSASQHLVHFSTRPYLDFESLHLVPSPREESPFQARIASSPPLPSPTSNPLKMGGNASKVTAQDKAILDLKLQRDKLHQYQRRITVLTDKETAVAKQMLAKGDKPRALLALRRKKYQESLLQKTDAQLEQLEKLTSSVEFAMIQKDVVFGLQQGTKVLKEIHSEMGGIEHVEKLMGETADAIAYQKEVSDMLGGRISVQDEEEVEDELAALEASVAAEDAARNPPRQHKLPTVPDTELPVPDATEEEEPAAQQRVRTRQPMLAA
ncbi:Putative Snf7 family protein [Colletotrichum destructivum]|nr:Putative Snf7 family protein [Colletotrichum destructivum]